MEILDDFEGDYYEENDILCLDNGESYFLDDLN